MGTPLGPTIANFFMCNLENNAFENHPNLKPTVYCRYIDDILIVIDNFQQLTQLQELFITQSSLNFTYEIETNKKLSFLYTLIKRKNNELITTVYRKSTNTGECLNYNSICPEKYKTSVIRNLLYRAYSICSNWHEFDVEVRRIKQILINNNFPNWIVDKTINAFLGNKHKITTTEPTTATNRNDEEAEEQSDADSDQTTQVETIKLYFRNQMTNTYKQVERELKKIVYDYVTEEENKELKILIYYRNKKLKNLLIKNNMHKPNDDFNVVYKYSCDQVPCTEAQSCYIGYTTTTVKERFKQHASIKKHFRTVHNRNITGSEMIKNVSILAHVNNKIDLILTEALLIKEHGPVINIQTDDFNRTLKIFK